MKIAPTAALFSALALAACGGSNDAAEQAADQLDNAAEQSDPAAAQVLENAADQVRETDSPAAAQNALQEAGNAQATTLPTPQTPPPAKGAMPNQPNGSGNAQQPGGASTNRQ